LAFNKGGLADGAYDFQYFFAIKYHILIWKLSAGWKKKKPKFVLVFAPYLEQFGMFEIIISLTEQKQIYLCRLLC
jgi:hypothetical protein